MANARNAFTAEELDTKTMDELTKLSQLAENKASHIGQADSPAQTGKVEPMGVMNSDDDQ